MRDIKRPHMDGCPMLDRIRSEMSHFLKLFNSYSSLLQELYPKIKQLQVILEEDIGIVCDATDELNQAMDNIEKEKETTIMKNQTLRDKIQDITQCGQSQNEAQNIDLQEECDRLAFYEKEYLKNGETLKLTQTLEDMAESYTSLVKQGMRKSCDLTSVKQRIIDDNENGEDILNKLHDHERRFKKYLHPTFMFEEETDFNKKDIEYILNWLLYYNDLFEKKLREIKAVFDWHNRLSRVLHFIKEMITKGMQSLRVKILHERVCIELVQARTVKVLASIHTFNEDTS